MSTARADGRPVGRPRGADKHEAILLACFALLSEVGYARMSIDTVARRAGVTRPTVYRRWASKEALAVAALERAQSGIVDLPRTGDPRTDLVTQLASLHQTLSRPHGMSIIATMLVEERHTPALIEGFRRRVVTARREALYEIFRAALPGAEPGRVELCVDFAVGAFYARYIAGAPFPDDWADRTADALLGSSGTATDQPTAD